MTLGDIIKDYRKTHNLSMDAFSEKSGISKAYISLLEKNRHPKTGNTIAPSIQCIKQAADGMRMDFNVLFSMIDSDVTVNGTEKAESNLSERDKREIGRDLDRIMDEIENDVDGPLYYNGTPIDGHSLDMLRKALELGLMELKKENKVNHNSNKSKGRQ